MPRGIRTSKSHLRVLSTPSENNKSVTRSPQMRRDFGPGRTSRAPSCSFHSAAARTDQGFCASSPPSLAIACAPVVLLIQISRHQDIAWSGRSLLQHGLLPYSIGPASFIPLVALVAHQAITNQLEGNTIKSLFTLNNEEFQKYSKKGGTNQINLMSSLLAFECLRSKVCDGTE